jgi:hypothetical protein
MFFGNTSSEGALNRTAKQSFDIVVSSDNNDYLAWQCLVFHHSCLAHLGVAPIFVVHGDDKPLAAAYRILEEKGGLIQRLAHLGNSGSIEYSGRNVWATVKHVKTTSENIVLCDPDMIFLRHIDFAQLAARLDGESVSYDAVGYMKVGDHNRVVLEDVCKGSWINTGMLGDIKIGGGVPYIIPVNLRRQIVREWATLTEACLEASFRYHGIMNSEVWISVMWGFVLACLRRGIPMTLTNICATNNPKASAGDGLILRDRQMVHYCYFDEFFNKKNFINEIDSLKTVWKVEAPGETVNGAVTRAIRDAAAFYGLG